MIELKKIYDKQKRQVEIYQPEHDVKINEKSFFLEESNHFYITCNVIDSNCTVGYHLYECDLYVASSCDLASLFDLIKQKLEHRLIQFRAKQNVLSDFYEYHPELKPFFD